MSGQTLQVQRACNLSGLNQKHARLKEAEQFLEQLIKDAELAQSEHDLYRNMELIARGVKVACDIAVDMLGSAVDKAAPGVGTGISEVYDISKLLVEAFNQSLGPKQAFEYSTKKKLWAIKEHIGTSSKPARLIKSLEQMYDLGNEIAAAASGAGGGDGIRSAQRSAQAQLARLRQQIRQIEMQMNECVDEGMLLV